MGYLVCFFCIVGVMSAPLHDSVIVLAAMKNIQDRHKLCIFINFEGSNGIFVYRNNSQVFPQIITFLAAQGGGFQLVARFFQPLNVSPRHLRHTLFQSDIFINGLQVGYGVRFKANLIGLHYSHRLHFAGGFFQSGQRPFLTVLAHRYWLNFPDVDE